MGWEGAWPAGASGPHCCPQGEGAWRGDRGRGRAHHLGAGGASPGAAGVCPRGVPASGAGGGPSAGATPGPPGPLVGLLQAHLKTGPDPGTTGTPVGASEAPLEQASWCWLSMPWGPPALFLERRAPAGYKHPWYQVQRQQEKACGAPPLGAQAAQGGSGGAHAPECRAEPGCWPAPDQAQGS